MCRSEFMKKLIALILCAVMALALCACNNNVEDEPVTENYDTVSTDPVVIGPSEDAKIFEAEDGSSSAYYYTEDGKLKLVCNYNADGSLKECREYSYDENDNCNSERVYGAQKEFKSGKIYFYNQKGDILKINFYDAQGKLDYFSEYRYGDNGVLLATPYYEEDGRLINEAVIQGASSSSTTTTTAAEAE